MKFFFLLSFFVITRYYRPADAMACIPKEWLAEDMVDYSYTGHMTEMLRRLKDEGKPSYNGFPFHRQQNDN
jgi:hypothetical protein